jgi:hypothetical protein
MTTPRLRAVRDQRGASLILAITFMVVVGGVSLATLSYITNGATQRKALDQARNREYAADGAVEYAIAQVRENPAILAAGGPGVAPCSINPQPQKVNGFAIHVDCANAPTLAPGGFVQRNVIFTACEGTAPCKPANAIVRAQINYQASSVAGTLTVTRTWVQSWSVNR